MGVDFNFDCARNIKPARPRLHRGCIVNLLFILVRKVRHTLQHTAGHARMQVGQITKCFVAVKSHPGLLRMNRDGTQRVELIGEYAGEAARTRSEIMFHQNGFTTTRITMPMSAGSTGISFNHR